MARRRSHDTIELFLDEGLDIVNRIIYMSYGDPDSDVELDHILAARTIKQLYILHNIDSEKPINILINCQGGDVQHGLAIYDTIRSLSNEVVITVVGHCYSMASWVLQAGDIRKATRNSSIMIHNGEGSKDGFSQEMDARCDDILLEKIREKHPRYTMKKLQELLKKDTYMWPEEALDLGLIDEII